MKPILVIGAAGQDGTLLSELLEKEAWEVFRGTRKNLALHDASAMEALIKKLRPAEIYFLAAHHHSSQDAVSVPPERELEQMLATNTMGLMHCLEGIRKESPVTKLFYASSSQIFGNPKDSPQTESTPKCPLTLYGVSKVAGMNLCHLYREKHGVFASSGILYNHESRLRAEKFVSQKIIQAAKRIKAGSKETLQLGDLDAVVDWGYAPDYVKAMRMILALDEPQDFIIASGTAHTVRDFAKTAFAAAGLDWQKYVSAPAGKKSSAAPIIGNPAKLKSTTGWSPSLSFEKMIELLVTE